MKMIADVLMIIFGLALIATGILIVWFGLLGGEFSINLK